MRGEVERRENFLSRKTSREARPREWPALLQKLSLLWMIQSIWVSFSSSPPKPSPNQSIGVCQLVNSGPCPAGPTALLTRFPQSVPNSG